MCRNSSAASTAVVSTKSIGKPMSVRTVRVRYSSNEDIITLKAVVAARKHVTRYGLVVKQLDAATRAMNCNALFRVEI